MTAKETSPPRLERARGEGLVPRINIKPTVMESWISDVVGGEGLEPSQLTRGIYSPLSSPMLTARPCPSIACMCFGRDAGIRTRDLLPPRQAR